MRLPATATPASVRAPPAAISPIRVRDGLGGPGGFGSLKLAAGASVGGVWGTAMRSSVLCSAGRVPASEPFRGSGPLILVVRACRILGHRLRRTAGERSSRRLDCLVRAAGARGGL